MSLYEWRSWRQPRSRLQTIAQRTPAVAPQKKTWRSQSHFFKQHESQGIDQNTEDTLKLHRRRCSAGGTLGLPPPTQETLRVIASYPVPQRKKEAGGGAHTTTHAVALVCSRRCDRTQTRIFPSSPIQKVELDFFLSSLKPALRLIR